MSENKVASLEQETDTSSGVVLDSKVAENSKENATESPKAVPEEKSEVGKDNVGKEVVPNDPEDIPTLPATSPEKAPSESVVPESLLEQNETELSEINVHSDSKNVESDSIVPETNRVKSVPEKKEQEINPSDADAEKKEHEIKPSDSDAEKNSSTLELKEKTPDASVFKKEEEQTPSTSNLEARDEADSATADLEVKQEAKSPTASDKSETQPGDHMKEKNSLPIETLNLNETESSVKRETTDSADSSTNITKEDKEGLVSAKIPPSEEKAADLSENTTDHAQDMFGMTEEEALSFLKEERDAKEASAGPPKIELYGSSVSGNMKIKKAQNKMMDTLERFKIPYEFVDLAADEQAKLYIKRKNPTSTTIPQLYIDGEFKMEFDEFEELLEYDELFEALGVEPDF